MQFSKLVEDLISQTTTSGAGGAMNSLWCFRPELVISVTIVVLLLVRLVNIDRFIPNHMFALFGALAAFFLSLHQWHVMSTADTSIAGTFFTGLLAFDQFTVFFRIFLLLFLILTITLTVLTGLPDNEDGPDFYVLLLGATLGMMLMASSNHLLMLFLSIEMASVPSYAMVGFLKGRKKSSEAALKYVVYGAGTAGVMLYGISLLCGVLGTGDFGMMATQLSTLVSGEEAVGVGNPIVRTVILGIMLVMVGLAFKLSLFPFHFWCPDAFEGASAEVAGFLSVASKAGAFALMIRFVLAFSGGAEGPGQLGDVYISLGLMLGFIAGVTATYGNLTAYKQTNIKRMLAYSTIAHAGYMLMAVAALLVILNAPADTIGLDRAVDSQNCIQGILFYLAVYLFMNLGAFAVVALIRNQTYSEEIKDYAGVASQAPVLAGCMLVCFFSLIGMPPFGGFLGKLMIFAAAFKAGSVHWFMYVVVAVAGLNTVLSLFYYLNVLKLMFIRERPEGSRPVKIAGQPTFYVLALAVVVLALGGLFPWPVADGITSRAQDIASGLLGN